MNKLAQLIFFAVFAAVLLVDSSAGQVAPYPVRVLRPLERLVLDLAQVNRKSDADDLRQILAELGYPEKSLVKLAERQAKVRVAKRIAVSRLQRIARAISRVVNRLVQHFDEIEGADQRKRVATALLRLDETLAKAHVALGHEKLDGRWVLPEVKAMSSRKAVVQVALQQVRKLTPDIIVQPSKHELILLVHGKPAQRLSFRGFEMHTAWQLSKAKRLMSNIIRAVALSKFLIHGGHVELPKDLRYTGILLTGMPQYRKALEYDTQNGRINDDMVRNASTYTDYFRKSGTYIHSGVGEHIALTTMYTALSEVASNRLFGENYLPTLIAGHSNWVLMALTGAHLPMIPYKVDKRVRGSAADPLSEQRELLLSAGLMGARSWLQYKVRSGTDPAWSKSFVSHVGKIGDVDMLKTTFIAEYLHYLGPIGALLKNSRGIASKPKPEMIAILEKGLGTKLFAFEESWRIWMRDIGSSGTSILGRLSGKSTCLSKVERLFLAELTRIRSAALVEESLSDIPKPTLDRELANNALLHATYLNKHPDQLSMWPDAHEEFTDHAGFTPEGCWAGNHSVIMSGATTAKQALDGWMGTFFHRLPLLDPGLLRVGWALAGTTAVLDSGSMVRKLPKAWEVVWPPDGMRDVPRRFRPELPNPYPGVEQRDWGYPITVQLGSRENATTPEIEITLRKGSAKGALVAGRVTSPQSPGNPQLVPAMAWCFIPAKHLAAGTHYHVAAAFSGADKRTLRWSFSTGREFGHGPPGD